MINSRDSYTDFNPNKKELIEVPYRIGTVVELIDNPSVLARICEYRITIENLKQVINVGLSCNIYDEETNIDYEITVEELIEQWKKTDKIIFRKIDSLDSKRFIKIPGL